jgi:hypothetical protein
LAALETAVQNNEVARMQLNVNAQGGYSTFGNDNNFLDLGNFDLSQLPVPEPACHLGFARITILATRRLFAGR